jgi:hypothetical protein
MDVHSMYVPLLLIHIAPSPLDVNVYGQKLTIIEAYIKSVVDGHVSRYSLNFGITGVSCWYATDPHITIPLLKLSEGSLHATLHLPYGVSAISAGARLADGSYICDMLDMAEFRPEHLSKLSPPAIIVGAANDRIRLANDAIGFGRLYQYRARGWTIWTNCLALAPILSGAHPESDEDGWATLATVGWFLGDLTAYRNATVVPPASFISIVSQTGAITHTRSTDFRDSLATGEPLSNADVTEASDAITRYFDDCAV